MWILLSAQPSPFLLRSAELLLEGVNFTWRLESMLSSPRVAAVLTRRAEHRIKPIIALATTSAAAAASAAFSVRASWAVL